MSFMPFALDFGALVGTFTLGRRTSPRLPAYEVADRLRAISEQLRDAAKPAALSPEDALSETIKSTQELSATAHRRATGRPVSMLRGKVRG